MDEASGGHPAGSGPSVLPAKVRAPVVAALPRERLERRLALAWERRLTLVTGPAGSGKTTLLARFASACGRPVAWYRAEALDGDERAFLAHLEAAARAVVPVAPGAWTTVEDALHALTGPPVGRVLVVLDDAHALEGTAAEAALGRLVDFAPPSVAVVVASRIVPGLNVSRHRVAGELEELDADDLRFRSWEVEHLFRSVYGDPVRPDLLASLTRRTEGWAAGLQLFHLASRGKPIAERERLVHATGSRSRLVRDYVGRNVLAALPDELGDFLARTFVLGRLTAARCDRLVERTGSARLLEELVRRQVFTVRVDDDGAYRYHEVLRTHLDRLLVEDLGEAEVRRRHARAGTLLEEDGELADALVAFCRAEDWGAVERIVRAGGERLTAGTCAWLEALPPAIARHDPWIALATARRARGAGRWQHALEAYARAEEGFGEAAPAAAAARERAVVAAWIDPAAIHPEHWLRAVRSGLARDPGAAAAAVASEVHDERRLGAAILRLAAGQLPEARSLARAALEGDPLAPDGAAVARLVTAACDLLGGDGGLPGSVVEAGEAADAAGLPWLAEIARGLARRAAGVDEVTDGPGPEPGTDEPWSAALLDLATALLPRPTGGRGEARIAAAVRAAAAFRALGSPVLEAWAAGAAAGSAVEARPGVAAATALEAEEAARAAAVPGALLLAYRALDRLGDPAGGGVRSLLASLERACGLAEPVRATGAPTAPTAVPGALEGADGGRDGAPGRVRVTTLGRFEIEVDGVPLALATVRPRARQLLRLLALSAGSGVHREVLAEHLWPDADPAAAARSLQVAISALRGLLPATDARGSGSLVVRDGDAYRLAVAPDDVDVARFDRFVTEGRSARARGGDWATPFVAALDLHRGELLPEDGPAEWVVARRGFVRAAAADAACMLAEGDLAAGRCADAIAWARRGLEIDRYHDGLWRTLIEGRERSGEAGAARRDRRAYEELAAGLG